MTGNRIVIIDDGEIVLAALSLVLRDAGPEVRAVNSLRHLLNAVLDWKPQLNRDRPVHAGDDRRPQVCAWLHRQPELAQHARRDLLERGAQKNSPRSRAR